MSRRSAWLGTAFVTALVVAPALLLIGVAARGLSQQEAALRDAVVGGLRDLARAKAEAAAREALSQEEGALRAVAGPEGKNVLGTLRSLSRKPDLVEEYFLASPEGDILFPLDLRGQSLIVERESKREDEEGRQLLDDARRLAHTEGKRDDARAAYERACLPPYGRTLRVEALAELGAYHFGAKEYAEALAAYQRLLSEVPASYVEPDVRLLVRFQIAASLDAEGNNAEAERSYRAFLGDALGETPSLPIVPATRWFVSQALARLRAMSDARRLSEEGRGALAEFSRLEKAKLEPGGVVDALRNWVLPVLRREGVPSEGAVRDLFEVIDGRPTLVALRRVEGGGRTLALGFVVRLDRLSAALGASLDAGTASGVALALSSGTNRLLGPQGEPVASVRAPSPLDFAEVFVLPLSSDTVEGPVRRQRVRGYLLLGLLSVVLGAGVVATLRGTAQARRFARLQSDFVANVSHDLKTPLALIRLFAETLLRKGTDAAKTEEYHRIIARESERLTHMVNNLLDFSRTQEGKRVYERRPEDLREIASHVAEALRPRFEEEGFRLDVELPKGPLVAAVDAEAVSSVLANLLDNAQKYSGDGREVRLRLSEKNGCARIEVSDRGIGIPREELDKVFEKFHRGADPRVRAEKGSGLGLALVRHIAEGHGGRAWVEPNGGKGTLCVVELPR